MSCFSHLSFPKSLWLRGGHAVGYDLNSATDFSNWPQMFFRIWCARKLNPSNPIFLKPLSHCRFWTRLLKLFRKHVAQKIAMLSQNSNHAWLPTCTDSFWLWGWTRGTQPPQPENPNVANIFQKHLFQISSDKHLFKENYKTLREHHIVQTSCHTTKSQDHDGRSHRVHLA